MATHDFKQIWTWAWAPNQFISLLSEKEDFGFSDTLEHKSHAWLGLDNKHLFEKHIFEKFYMIEDQEQEDWNFLKEEVSRATLKIVLGRLFMLAKPYKCS